VHVRTPPAATLGALVVNGLIMRIDRVLLRAGVFQLEASTEVTHEATIRPGDECRIHGADGTVLGVLTLRLPDGPATARGRPGASARLTLVLPLHLASFVGESAWPQPS
jgi:hypothetical protein